MTAFIAIASKHLLRYEIVKIDCFCQHQYILIFYKLSFAQLQLYYKDAVCLCCGYVNIKRCRKSPLRFHALLLLNAHFFWFYVCCANHINKHTPLAVKLRRIYDLAYRMYDCKTWFEM